MDIKKVIRYWQDGYQDVWLTAEKLFEAKRYHHCLFFGHLALEKLLKAVVVNRIKKHATPTHDLKRLVKEAGLDFPIDYFEDLKEIDKYNVRARYDDIKFKFYKLATREYALIWFNKIKEICQWLEKQL